MRMNQNENPFFEHKAEQESAHISILSLQRVDTVTQMNDDKSYLPLDFCTNDFAYIYIFELMHFKCLIVVALMALCKQRRVSNTT